MTLRTKSDNFNLHTSPGSCCTKPELMTVTVNMKLLLNRRMPHGISDLNRAWFIVQLGRTKSEKVSIT